MTKTSWYNRRFSKQFGVTLLKDIKRTKYEAYISSLLNSYSRATVIQINALFEAMVTDAVVNGYLDKNLILKIYIGKSSIPIRKKRLSSEEFRSWDECARKILSSYDYTMARLTYSGLRRSKVLGIKFSLLKLMNGRFRILLDGNRTERRSEGGRIKTRTSKCYVLPDEETTDLLQKAMMFAGQIAKESNRILGQNDFIFVDEGANLKKRRGESIKYAHIATIFKKVSVEPKIHAMPHMMRHSFATQGQIAGASIEHMAAALGHPTSCTTQQYAHIKGEVAGEVTDLFLCATK